MQIKSDEKAYDQNLRKVKKKPKIKTARIIADIVFYFAIAMIIVKAVGAGNKSDHSPRVFFGYSYFHVLTASMQNEIPQGSFVLVKHSDTRDIKVGDVITYMKDYETSVTHKVVAIYENFDGSGKMGFQTQGVNNANPDPEIVSEINVVGVAMMHVPYLGAVIAAISSNIIIILIIFGLVLLLLFLLKGVFAKEDSAKSKKLRKETKHHD